MNRNNIDLDAWFAGNLPPGGRFRHNDSVRIIAGDHTDEVGAVISIEAIEPEPVYLVEFGSGRGDVLIPDSHLALTGE